MDTIDQPQTSLLPISDVTKHAQLMKWVSLIRNQWRLLTVVAIYLILGVIYGWLVPPFEGPDESQHFAYIEWLVSGKGFPPQGEAAWDTSIEQEAGQPPLYYLIASIPARLIDLNNPPAVFRPNPYFVAPLPRDVTDNDNRAIHYPNDAHPLAGGWLAFYLARATTLGWGILLLVGIYGLTRAVVPGDRRLALLTTFLVAVNPQVIYIGSMISNDIPVAAMGTLALWLLAAIIRRGPSRRLGIGLGIVFGAAVLLKVNAFILILPVGAGLFWLWRSRQASLWQIVELGGFFGLSAFLTAGWWFIRIWYLYGSPLGVETHDLTPWAITKPEMLADFHLRWFDVARSFWISLGWGTIRPPGWVYTILLVFSLLSLLGLLRAARRWWRLPASRPHQNTVALLAILTLALFIVALFLEWWMRRVIAPYGRLLFPAIGSIVILLMLGWRALHRQLAWIPLGFVAGLALVTPIKLILPAYTPPPLLSPEEAGELSPIIGWRFAEPGQQPFAELLTLEPLKQSADSDTVLPVRLCWRALGTTEKNYTVLLQIIGPNNSLITGRRSYHGQGLYPTSIWHPGDTFCDLMHIRIWDNIRKTLVYQLEISLFDEEREERLPVFDGRGNHLDATFVDKVRLVASEVYESPHLKLPDSGTIQLVSSELPPTWHLNQENKFTVSWGTATPLGEDYQLFVHLRDPGSGENVAQADGPPLGGWYPTSWWQVQELVVDERTFKLPPDLVPGTYNLVVGFYNLVSEERFGEEYLLGSVRVVP